MYTRRKSTFQFETSIAIGTGGNDQRTSLLDGLDTSRNNVITVKNRSSKQEQNVINVIDLGKRGVINLLIQCGAQVAQCA